MLSPLTDEMKLQNQDQDVAVRGRSVKEVLQWYECCRYKLSSSEALVAGQLFTSTATRMPSLHVVYRVHGF